ncbi:MAG: hypothetical protein WAS27_04010 [Candidatus Saccharimonadales bacterium]
MDLQEFANAIGDGECSRLYCSYTPHTPIRRQVVKTCGDVAMYIRSMQQHKLGYFCMEWEYPYGRRIVVRCLSSNMHVTARVLDVRSMQVVAMNGDEVVGSVCNMSPFSFTGATLRHANHVLQPFLGTVAT